MPTFRSLHHIGPLLYGEQWQSPLARALGVNLRTMQRWAAGEYEPPVSLWRDLADLLCERQREIARALDGIA